MTDKVLGIDIGDDAIKAVVVSRSFKGGYRLVASEYVEIEPAGGVALALQKLIENQNFNDCPATTALPLRCLSFRNIRLPFRDEKRIRQVLAFEVDPLLHFPVDEAVVDHIIVHKAMPSELFVAVAPKAAIQERTAIISRYVSKIEQIDADGAATATLLSARRPVDECALLLDIGAEHSAVHVICSGRLRHIRPLAFGGNDITRTIAETLEVSADQAERSKCNNDSVGGQIMEPLFFKVLFELDNTIEFMKLHGQLDEPPNRIWLTGGGALYAPLREALSKHFTIPVEMLDLLADDSIQCDQATRARWNPMIMNQALALAISGHQVRHSFNFSMRESKLRAGIQQLQGEIRWAAAIVAIFLILAATDVYLDDRYNRQRLETLKTEMIALYKTHHPQAARIVDPVSQMKGSIIEARKSLLGIAEARQGMTVLTLLKDISRLAPPAAELLLGSLFFEKDTILLKGQAKNFDAVDMLKREFMNSAFFESITVGAVTLTKQGDKVEFDMRVLLKK